MTPPAVRVAWTRAHRLVLAQYPRIDIFDDIADPRDWEVLAAAQARTNPRILDLIGDLSRVPPDRRLSGDGASWVMGAFTHVSPDRQSRFSDGGYGVYYAGESLDTAFCEHSFHMGRFYASAAMPAGWLSQVRQLVGGIDATLLDLRGGDFAPLLDPVDYSAPQAFARARRDEGADGIVYPSVRRPGGECIAAFWPDVVKPPMQGDHFRYYWDGTSVVYARRITGEPATFRIADLAGA